MVRAKGQREFTLLERNSIHTLRSIGWSYRKIANHVGKGSASSIKYVLDRQKELDSLKNRVGRGSQSRLRCRSLRYLKLLVLNGRRKVLRQLCEELNNMLEKPVCTRTVRRALKKLNFTGRIAARKPLLRKQNVRKRLVWARLHRDWTFEDWRKVLWTDESQFFIYGTKRRFYVRRRPGEKYFRNCLHPTVKHGKGSVMVWGAFSADGTAPLKHVQGKMTMLTYKQILIHHAKKAGIQLIGRGFVFQQDNDPKHKSRLCTNYLNSLEAKKVLKIMIWPPQSPDLNPIEQLWAYLDCAIDKSKIKNGAQLFQEINRAWLNIGKDVLVRYVKSIPARCRAVIAAKGGHTKY